MTAYADDKDSLRREAARVIDDFSRRSVLVIGDMVADIYLTGVISRISREAPVLVLEHSDEKIVAGGAANVANNVATLGGKVHVVGLIGQDKRGEQLKNILVGSGAAVEGILVDAERPTITKTRIIAGGRATVSQQIVRIDHEAKTPLSSSTESRILALLADILPRTEAVILSDYGSGTVTSSVSNFILANCRKLGIPSMVDSRYDVRRFVGVDYVKQNDAELAAAVGRVLDDEESLTLAGDRLRGELMAKGILVTRGEKGMTLIDSTGRQDIPVSDKSEVYDVSGAGDTCVAAFALSLAGGASPMLAAALSNIASGIAVRKLGTATVSKQELAESLYRL